MIDANKGSTPDTLRRLKQGSEERFRIQLFECIESLLDEFNMTWGDLAKKLQWKHPLFSRLMRGEEIKVAMGRNDPNVVTINDIAHVFSTEPYILFRPRKPYAST